MPLLSVRWFISVLVRDKSNYIRLIQGRGHTANISNNQNQKEQQITITNLTMENIHIFPTDKPSSYVTNYMEQNMQWQHIYITSDEEIKEGDWFISNLNEILKCTKKEDKFVWYERLTVPGVSKIAQPFSIHVNLKPKKIILTTDQDLIKDGVQLIDDEFLEWFVKNPSCEEVIVTKGSYNLSPMEEMLEKEYVPKGTFDTYKIIIPKEEPKQERMYSEDDLRNAYRWGTTVNHGTKEHFNEWFEQFKKK